MDHGFKDYKRDHWNDPGMAFSIEEVMNYSVYREIGKEVQATLDFYQIVRGYEQRIRGQHVWARDTAKNARECVTWFCKKGYEVPSDDVWEVPTVAEKQASEGRVKELYLITCKVSPWDLMSSELARVEATLRRNATLGLQAKVAQKWMKRDWSYSNKFVYALYFQWWGYKKRLHLLKFVQSAEAREAFDEIDPGSTPEFEAMDREEDEPFE